MTLPSAVFALQTPNLGDDLQAMAIAAFSPSIKTVFHRELIGNPQLKDAHTVVMNYWFMSKNFESHPIQQFSQYSTASVLGAMR